MIKLQKLALFIENKVRIKIMTNVKIKAEENGPLLVEVDRKTTITLCRFGKSCTQPSCDDTHAKIGFKFTAS
ncbi:MAG: CDGSH iron-sulfur domain-containing protein [Nitrosopumilus sp.]|nr:CDGSH iron-sulfur domain-containing protein [Nitrosopumilus sp.]MDH3516127.1 CDGSH iron-sulfur domain-containing protein [Nitrosopumilus sp.]MDH3564614.1 CDGSH iron-sulfur domain-containing protein [Nitrosopumilus sp.]MDH5418002.1 CDGSH iron-sulfur domain-containing protein [Nitrosopumilus sp.]MDH5555591.1 CDGSH iron-sulfur domain-containing protein [Nitrosopumilus sp.]